MIQIPDKPKQRHTCKDCALKHILKGAVDFNKTIQGNQNMKQELIDKIMALMYYLRDKKLKVIEA